MKLSNIVNTALYLQGGRLDSILSQVSFDEAEYAFAARKHMVRSARRCYGTIKAAAQYTDLVRVLGPKGKLP